MLASKLGKVQSLELPHNKGRATPPQEDTMSSRIPVGARIKDSTGRWATVLEVTDNVLTVDKPWQYVHTDNVQAIRYPVQFHGETRYVSIPED